jgi:hypothetical protein
MKYILLTLVVFSACHFVSCKETRETPCNDYGSLVNKTIESLNNRDKNAFRSLVEFDMVIKSMHIAVDEMASDATFDSDLKDLMRDNVNLVRKNPDKYYTDLNTVFDFFIETFDEETKTKDWKMKLVDFAPKSKDDDGSSDMNTLVINVMVNNKKYQLYSKFYREDGCQYVVLPLEPKIGDEQ